MKLTTTLSVAAFAVGLMTCAQQSFGLAALANGCKTSCKVTATDPVQRAIQQAADPAGIIDWQFTMHFDPNKVSIANFGLGHGGPGDSGAPITALNGYVLGLRGNATAPAVLVNLDLGLISVRGYYPNPTSPGSGGPSSGDVNVFAVTFVLDPALPLDTVLNFDVLGLDAANSLFTNPDFMNEGDVDANGNPIVTRNFFQGSRDGGIFPSFSGPETVLPEPASAAMVLPAGLLLARRVRR